MCVFLREILLFSDKLTAFNAKKRAPGLYPPSGEPT
jgi:hypothetical protein